jgi:hypothetical protein
VSEGETGFAFLIATCVVVAVVVHSLERRPGRAIAISGVVSPALFQVFAYLHAGYLDPFFIIAFIVTAGIALAIASAIGALFVRYRATRSNRERRP